MAERKPTDPDYLATAWLADLVRDLEEAGVLEGQAKFTVWEFVEHFRVRSASDPDHWHTDFFEIYEELRGHAPEKFEEGESPPPDTAPASG